MRRAPALIVCAALAACAIGRGAQPLPPLPFATDTVRSEEIAPGVIRRFIYAPSGPWGIYVLDVDLTRCNAAIAVKGASTAAGRTQTTKLLNDLSAMREVIGGVNADFFSLANGTPVGALIINDTVVTGPYTQPVLAFDSAGNASALVLHASVTVASSAQSLDFSNWNRAATGAPTFFDSNWGRATDTASQSIEVVLDGSPLRVIAIDTAKAGVPIPPRGAVLMVGRTADSLARAAVMRFRVGDSVRITRRLAPVHPREAVGGRPMLVRDSAVVPEVETEGQASFIARNPRTAAGIARNGRRLILAVIDGRQKGYSDGMTLRETADLMRALGARDAINLDGGGSSTLVYRTPAGMRIANHPSDSLPNGVHVERPVGDALAIVRTCRR
jgi:hypothetical protein